MQKRRSQMDRFIGKTSRSVDWERGHPKVLDNPAIYIKDKIQPAQSVSRSRRTLGSLSAHPSPSGRTPTCLCFCLSVCLHSHSAGAGDVSTGEVSTGEGLSAGAGPEASSSRAGMTTPVWEAVSRQ